MLLGVTPKGIQMRSKGSQARVLTVIAVTAALIVTGFVTYPRPTQFGPFCAVLVLVSVLYTAAMWYPETKIYEELSGAREHMKSRYLRLGLRLLGLGFGLFLTPFAIIRLMVYFATSEDQDAEAANGNHSAHAQA